VHGADGSHTRHISPNLTGFLSAFHAPDASRGETLLHLDVRADNIVLTPDRVYIVDWPWAAVGAWWVDVLAMASSVTMQGGPSPEDFLAAFPAAGQVDPGAIDLTRRHRWLLHAQRSPASATGPPDASRLPGGAG